jgi:hypothetical protein
VVQEQLRLLRLFLRQQMPLPPRLPNGRVYLRDRLKHYEAPQQQKKLPRV